MPWNLFFHVNMVALNLRELIIIVTGITVLTGLLIVYLKYTAPHIKGTLQWAIGSFLVSIGLLAYGFYPRPAEYINLLLTNMNAFAGQCFFLIAFWKFKEKPINYFFIVSVLVSAFLITTIFTLTYHHMGLRVTINSILYAVVAAYCFYEMLIPPDRSLRLIFHINALAILLYGLAMMTRAVVSFQQKEIDLMAPTLESIILFSAVSLSEIVLTFGFIIMVNIRLSQDLIRQNTMKDKFFSIIAHDLKNPMNNILGFSDLLAIKLNENNREEIKFISRAIKHSVIQTNNLLENLLEWALSQTGNVHFEPENINLQDIIADESEYYIPFAESKQLSFHTEKVKKINVWADRNMLKTILRNLVTNAMKYSHPGGSIHIESRQLSTLAEVSVIDVGVGIQPMMMDKLFRFDERVTTRGTHDEKGSGLGLVLCKEFVEKNKGTIWAKSEPGKGTTFYFTLPLFRG